MELQKLTVHNYSEELANERRITLSPMHIVLVAAGTDDISIRGRSLRIVSIMFDDGGSIDLILNHSDLELLESAIGSFCLGI
jgi:hypothetical protein